MSGRLSLRETLGYAAGDLGINFYFQSALTFLLFFYTDTFGISAAVAGWVFLVARVVDAVTDPLMGAIADRTRTRWGRLRPYLVFGALPLAAISVATFSVPDLDARGKVIWAFVTYTLFGVAYTVVSIPYSALTAVLTSDAEERTTLSTWRMGLAMVGGFVVSVGTLPLVDALGGGAAGFQATLGLYAAAATALLLVTFATTRERVTPAHDATPRLAESLRLFTANPPLWIVLFAFVLGMLAFTLRQSAVLYYFKYNLGREDLVPVFFAGMVPAMLAGIAAVPWLGRRLGKAGGILVGGVVACVGGIGVFLTPYDRVGQVVFFALVSAMGAGPISVLGWAMIPDTVEYAEWKTGVRGDGLIYAAASFGQKLAMAGGGAAAAAVLSATGYVANAEQDPRALDGILWLLSLLPVACVVLVLVAVSFYRLDGATHARIVAELEARRASARSIPGAAP